MPPTSTTRVPASLVPAAPVSASRPTPLSRELRSGTRAEHLAAEQALDIASVRTPADLAVLLRGWVSVWLAVRCAVHGGAACRTARTELLGPADQALAWLADDLDDLAALGAGPSDVPADASVPGRLADLLAGAGGSWGVAYVLRGSRLGGAVLAPQLSAAVGLPAGCGTRFLRSAGSEPGREWVAFRARLDALAPATDERSAAVAAARWTFGWVGRELVADRQRLDLR